MRCCGPRSPRRSAWRSNSPARKSARSTSCRRNSSAGCSTKRSTARATKACSTRGGSGDLAALDKASASKELRPFLVTAANRRWAEWIATRMGQKGKLLVAVGAGHLAGASV